MAERIAIENDSISLEGILDSQSDHLGVVVAHPHPLYGGTMDNDVVGVIADAFQTRGYTTLKINFRGVGNSGGQYDEGIGEQSDIFAAVRFLQQSGIQRIDLAGYSFGAWVIFNLVSHNKLSHDVTLVSPPVGFMKFDNIVQLDRLKCVVAGDCDEFAPIDQLKKEILSWNPNVQFSIIKGADHFYSGYLESLREQLIYSF